MSTRRYDRAFRRYTRRAKGPPSRRVRKWDRRRLAFRRGYNRTSGYYGRLNRAYNGEMKFHDIAVTDTSIASGGAIQNTGSINLIPQGTTEITRIGRKAVIKSINLRYQISIASGVDEAATADIVRVILYQDKQCNGVTAAILDILETAAWNSFRNLANSGRFIILCDKLHTINTTAAGGNGTAFEVGQKITHGSFFKKCSIVLEFDAAAGAITEIRSNNLCVLLISSQGTAGFDGQFRLRFTDS